MANHVLPIEQISMIVQCLRIFKLVEVGSPKWLLQHGQILALGEEAASDVDGKEEGQVKEEFMICDKITVLLNELICAQIWLQSVLSALLKINPNPKFILLIYATIYHEWAIVALLDSVLYHKYACEALGEAAIDLIHYCVLKINDFLLTPKEALSHTSEKEISVISKVKRQQNDISFQISLRCVSLLHHLTTSEGPLGSLRRIVSNYDVPLVMIALLKRKPWVRRTHTGRYQKFFGGNWQNVDELEANKVDKHEAKIWIFLRQVLIEREFMGSYGITDNRREEFKKCLKMLTENVLDQLPALTDLKEILARAILSNSFFSIKRPIILDIVPRIFKRLNNELIKHGGGAEIAKLVEPLYFSQSDANFHEVAKCLSKFYNSDVIADLEEITDTQKHSESQVPENDVTQRKKKEKMLSIHGVLEEGCGLKKLCKIFKKGSNFECTLYKIVHNCPKACQKNDSS